MIKKQIAIDFGGGFLRIYEKNVGFVFSAPASLAVEKRGKKYAIIATGEKAAQMQDENHLLVFSPIAEGTIQSPRFSHFYFERFSFRFHGVFYVIRKFVRVGVGVIVFAVEMDIVAVFMQNGQRFVFVVNLSKPFVVVGGVVVFDSRHHISYGRECVAV